VIKKSKVVDTVVKYQRVKTTFISTIIFIFCAICIGYSLYLLFIKKKKPHTDAVINKVNHKQVSNGPVTTVCILEVTYTINNKVYTNELVIENPDKMYNINEKIKINYNEDNHNKIELYTNDYKTAFILLFVGGIIFLFTYINLYLVRNSENYALYKTMNEL
jgi:hypothetical protein